MTATDTLIEQRASAAPRVTPADLEAAISSEWYINAADGVPEDEFHPPVPSNHPLRLLTFCVLVLKNGFTVTGESACVSRENFDAEIGRKVARENYQQDVASAGLRAQGQAARHRSCLGLDANAPFFDTTNQSRPRASALETPTL